MSGAVEAALQLLGGLGEDDRRWILEQLPAAAKARLLGAVGPETREDRLFNADPGAILEVLQTEPAWLVNAVLSAREWPWEAEVTRRLPGGMRGEVAGMKGHKVPKQAADFLLSKVSERLGENRLRCAAELPFESLVVSFARNETRRGPT